MKAIRTIAALAYSQVYHIVEDGKTLCGKSTRDPWEWIVFPEPPADLRECKRCGSSQRRFIGEEQL